MSEHTNCWCEPNVVRCSLPGCPRLPLYLAEQKKRREWVELMRRDQNHIRTDIVERLREEADIIKEPAVSNESNIGRKLNALYREAADEIECLRREAPNRLAWGKP